MSQGIPLCKTHPSLEIPLLPQKTAYFWSPGLSAVWRVTSRQQLPTRPLRQSPNQQVHISSWPHGSGIVIPKTSHSEQPRAELPTAPSLPRRSDLLPNTWSANATQHPLEPCWLLYNCIDLNFIHFNQNLLMNTVPPPKYLWGLLHIERCSAKEKLVAQRRPGGI